MRKKKIQKITYIIKVNGIEVYRGINKGAYKRACEKYMKDVGEENISVSKIVDFSEGKL
jgi:hypothetical protein